jgi:mono/diheme cytochrome c family protein
MREGLSKMNDLRTMRVSTGLVTLLAIGVFVPLSAGHAAASAEGEAAFKARCGDCHGPRDIAHWGRERPDAAKREAWLMQFLRKHYPPPEAERRPIVSYIQSAIAGGAAKK